MEGPMFVAIILHLLSALGSIEPLEVQLISVLLSAGPVPDPVFPPSRQETGR